MDCGRVWFIDAVGDTDEVGDSSSTQLIARLLILISAGVVDFFRREFLGRLEVVVLYTHGSKYREQCLQRGCSPEHRI